MLPNCWSDRDFVSDQPFLYLVFITIAAQEPQPNAGFYLSQHILTKTILVFIFGSGKA